MLGRAKGGELRNRRCESCEVRCARSFKRRQGVRARLAVVILVHQRPLRWREQAINHDVALNLQKARIRVVQRSDPQANIKRRSLTLSSFVDRCSDKVSNEEERAGSSHRAVLGFKSVKQDVNRTPGKRRVALVPAMLVDPHRTAKEFPSLIEKAEQGSLRSATEPRDESFEHNLFKT